MTSSRAPLTLGSLGLIALVPTLAGCASATESPAPMGEADTTVAEATPVEAPTAEPGVSQTPALYNDGTYQAQGGYQSPNGPETIELTITLAGNVITDITVNPGASNATSQRYQGQFAGGVAAETVGKSLDELQVSRVSGSSLTSGGFTQALESIKADARG
jgi:uncharacterized protein with FMN-binding domain